MNVETQHTHVHYHYRIFFTDGSEPLEVDGIGTKKDGSELIIVLEDGGFVSVNFDHVRYVNASVAEVMHAH